VSIGLAALVVLSAMRVGLPPTIVGRFATDFLVGWIIGTIAGPYLARRRGKR
jgi:hypothetical protein